MRFRFSALLCLSLSFLAGCSVQAPTTTPRPASAGSSGRIHGGQQPVSGATLQLYTVGTSADGSASTPLLTQTVTSDAGGNFNITGLYSCTGATLVYMTATGGNPGLTSANPNLAMMTALGPCSSLTPSTFISINELTTVAAVYALAPYMTSASAVGSTSAHTASLTSAFSLASQFVDPSTGQSPGINIPSGYSAPTVQLNTLADILASCINSTGGSSRDGSLCGSLFALTTPSGSSAPTDTISALLNLANNPQLNTYPLYNLITPSVPFQPVASSLPPDFRVRLAIPAAQIAIPTPAPTLTFASTTVFTNSATQTVPVQNTGSTPLSISSISLVGLNPSDFGLTNPCPATLQPNASCNVQVYFTPTTTGGRTAFLQINTTNPASPQYITLIGTGAANTASPTSIFLIGEHYTGSNPYTANSQFQTYSASANGSSGPQKTLQLPPNLGGGYLTTDHRGTLYASLRDYGTYGQGARFNVIDVFSIGSGGALTQTRSFTVTNDAFNFAADSTGRVFVPTFTQSGSTYSSAIYVYAANASGSATPAFSIPGCYDFAAVDSSGNLFSLDVNGNIVEYAAGFTATSQPIRTINLTSYYTQQTSAGQDLTTDNAGNIYYMLFEGRDTEGTNNDFQILEFSPSASGTATPTRRILGSNTQLHSPYSMSVDSNGTIYAVDPVSSSTGGPLVLQFAANANGNAAPATVLDAPTAYYSLGIAVY